MPRPSAPVATLIGDVVGSRRSADRPELHHSLLGALARINTDLAPVRPLRVTVGDEYQGCFDTVGGALRAALRLRLLLLPETDVRHGIGWGGAQVLEDDGSVEDGPGWWAARAAIDRVKHQADRAGTRSVRTGYQPADGVPGPPAQAVEAALWCRDELIAQMPQRARLVLTGLLAGRTQRELAVELGISASAVSQQVRSHGIAVVTATETMLAGVS